MEFNRFVLLFSCEKKNSREEASDSGKIKKHSFVAFLLKLRSSGAILQPVVDYYSVKSCCAVGMPGAF